VPLEIRQLIRAMSLANPLWGAPRIHGKLLRLGINVGQTWVAKYTHRKDGRRSCALLHWPLSISPCREVCGDTERASR
jgi:hypothetical protein